MEIQDVLLISIMLFAYCSGQKNLKGSSIWKYSSVANIDANYFYNPNITSANQVLRGSVVVSNNQKRLLKKDPTYFIVASQTIRPGHVYRFAVHILNSLSPITVKTTVLKDGLKISQVSRLCYANEPEIISMKVPPHITSGNYILRIEGYMKEILERIAFFNETKLLFSQQSMTVIIHTDKLLYRQGQTVNFRALPITVDLKAFKEPMDIFILDPKGYVVKRWLSHRTNYGVVSLSYSLPDQITPGVWKIQVSVSGQIEEQKYIVEEYYPTRFEVEVNMPPFIIDTEEFIEGTVEANYTTGAAVLANLTLLVSVHPPCIQCSKDKLNYFTERFVPYFEGIHFFRISLWELKRLSPILNRKQVTVTAVVTDKFLNEKITGFASSLISTTELSLKFIGYEPQIFKPFAPLKVYLALSYQDGSGIAYLQSKHHKMEIQTTVIYKRDNNEQLKKRDLKMMINNPGIWEVEIDLLSEPALNRKKLKDVKSLKLEAKYKDDEGKSAHAKLMLFRQLTPNDHHISISTSTKMAKVGEYIIFHVRTSFYILKFSYLIISKGLILTGGTETITSSIRTFAANVTTKMVPSATVVVYHVSSDGEIIADSLSFPVEGFPKNNFNISIHNIREKLNDTAEVVVKGKPGLFVGLSSINENSLPISRNQFSHTNLLQSFTKFDAGKNDTFLHVWMSKDNEENDFVTFPATSYAPDPYKTFKYAEIVVFTDGNLKSLVDVCDEGKKLLTCLTGKCYTPSQRCDGKTDCEDGSDESHCFVGEKFDHSLWKLYRQNHIQRFYENSWIWKDVIIGFQGSTIFNVSVPEQMTQWKINGFSVGKNKNVAVMARSIKIKGERLFYMKLELPVICKEGEQIGMKAVVFNNNPYELQASINLANSRDYKVIRAKSSVDPTSKRRANSEYSLKVLIQPLSSSTLHIAIIPKKIGEINVTVMAQSPLGKYSVNKAFIVEPYGIPQFRHSSTLLDLSNRAYLIKYFDINLTDASNKLFYNHSTNSAKYKAATLTVFGNIVGPLFPNVPMNTSVIFEKPSGSGEQNIFNFAINMYMLKYLNKTNVKNPMLEKAIFQYLNKVYAKQLSYQTSLGGFKMFRWNHLESVWLTAICIRIFNEGNLPDWQYSLYIDPSVINNALKWLLQHQTRYGAFYEEFLDPYDQKMNMASKKKEDTTQYRNITLTAHVTITLLSAKNLDQEMADKVGRSKNLAINYLERMLKVVRTYTDPYDLAIITYALTLAESSHIGEAFDLLNRKGRDVEGMKYWGKEVVPPPKYNVASNRPLLQARLPYKYDALNIEATAYALLVFVKKHELFKEQIVNWLNFQRLTDSGWASTQDTLIAYQALLEYFSAEELQGTTDISITVEATSTPELEKILNVNDEQVLWPHAVQIPNSWGTVRLLIRGHGLAVAQLSVKYYIDAPHLQIHPPVAAFSLDVNIDYSGNNMSHLSYESCQKWLLHNESNTSGMTVLEIEIPSGYYLQQQTLDAYVQSNSVPKLQNAQLHNRKVLFYFENLDSTETCITFIVIRRLPVAKLTKVMYARVYDYYAPEKFNEKIIVCNELNLLNICDVCGSSECPPCLAFDNANIIRLSWIMWNFVIILQAILYYYRNVI